MIRKALSVAGYALLHGGTRRLRAHESACIDAYLQVLDDDTAEVIRQQIGLTDWVYRSPGGKTVILKVLTTPEAQIPSLPNKDQELAVAVVTMRVGSEQARAEVIFEDGTLAGLRFRKSFKGRPSGAVTVTSTKITADITRASTESVLNGIPPEGMLAQIGKGRKIERLRPPASESVRNAFLSKMCCPIPDDLRLLLSECDGFAMSSGVFEGTRARSLPWPDDTLQVLVEDSGSTIGLCLRDSANTASFVLLNQIDADYVDCGPDLLTALGQYEQLYASTGA
ncbi:MAG TPA: hypothetical protein VK934_10395 [Fimbriimonas sp.]|nr:hypothetical protein [Fimbriimonas sp.]